jgi:hypothetical protein
LRFARVLFLGVELIQSSRDRVFGRSLKALVQRGVHAQPATKHAAFAEPRDELPPNGIDEIESGRVVAFWCPG